MTLGLRVGLCVAVLAATASVAEAQTGDGVTGRWLTQNGKGVIAIERCGDSICGKIDWMHPPDKPEPGGPIDRNNPNPALRQKPLCGLRIIYGFHRDGDQRHWVEGLIYDPESGDTYHANVTLEDGNHLRLRGYIGIPLLGESQIWTRAGQTYPPCHVS